MRLVGKRPEHRLPTFSADCLNLPVHKGTVVADASTFVVGIPAAGTRGTRLAGARSSVISATIFETGSKATTTPVVPAVPQVFAFSMQAEQSIVVDPKSPGGINSPHGLILFDGVCVLCSRGCRFVSKRDCHGYFRFVSDPVGRGTSAR